MLTDIQLSTITSHSRAVVGGVNTLVERCDVCKCRKRGMERERERERGGSERSAGSATVTIVQ